MVDLKPMMQDLVNKEITAICNAGQYLESFKAHICSRPGQCITIYEVETLERPVTKVIPTSQVFKDILCTTEACHIGLEESVLVSTTHSAEVSVSITASAKIFEVGMEFTTTVGYVYSHTSEESTALKYEYDLKRGESRYIGRVNAQVSARVRTSGYPCESDDLIHMLKCAALCLV